MGAPVFWSLGVESLSREGDLSTAVFPIHVHHNIVATTVATLFIDLGVLFRGVGGTTEFRGVVLPDIVSIRFGGF